MPPPVSSDALCRSHCVEAWRQMRNTHLVGCICPDGGDRKCSHVYSMFNHNPCLGDAYPARVASMSRVSRRLDTPLTREVPIPTTAPSLLVVSTSQTDPLYPLSTIYHYLQHVPQTGEWRGRRGCKSGRGES
ncbi:hypothetical protein GWK47_046734 [Chionoecetes opilio]|uniref:Uncharacterized protein n=1 Tax=Chionoecetes opilio TaxID=41210 RepID=A0A8J5CW81_CHIOP|nr:hypothetical protein GWK47_046734 [Chionoecetes opilio]